MLKFNQHFAKPPQKTKESNLSFLGFPFGLNTNDGPSMISSKELVEAKNVKLTRNGFCEFRGGIVKHTDTAVTNTAGTAVNPVDATRASLSGTQYDILSDADSNIYYMATASNTPTSIGSVEGSAYLYPYHDVVLIADGSYLKYCDDTSSVKIAYDAGDDGTQYDGYSLSVDSSGEKFTSTKSKIGVDFDTQDWDAGYTIPPTKMTAYLGKTGSPTGSIYYRIRNTADTTMASVELDYGAQDISTSGDYYSATFSSSDVTTELSPDTRYRALVEYSGATTANYLTIGKHQISFGEDTPERARYLIFSVGTAGGYISTADTYPVMKVQPGAPPKADFVTISKNRPWVKNPDYPGRLYYGNKTHLDWSTANGGGYVGVIDDNNTSFEPGGAEDLFGTLYVYGTEDQPYLCKLTGDTPSEYSIDLMFQRVWGNHRTIINCVNDIWAGSRNGVSSLAGVEEYGDLRLSRTTQKIDNKFSNWSSSAFAGYNNHDGQYWLYMPDYGNVLIGNINQYVSIGDDESAIIYPWTEYELNITPTFFKQVGDNFLIGATDGFVYKLDEDEYQDEGATDITYDIKTGITEFPLNSIDIIQSQWLGWCDAGIQFSMSYYVNKRAFAGLTKTCYLPYLPYDDLLVDDATMTVDDASIYVGPSEYANKHFINLNCRAIQLRLHGFTRQASDPVYIGGATLLYRQLQY